MHKSIWDGFIKCFFPTLFLHVTFRQEKQHERRLEVWSKIESLALQNPQVLALNESFLFVVVN